MEVVCAKTLPGPSVQRSAPLARLTLKKSRQGLRPLCRTFLLSAADATAQCSPQLQGVPEAEARHFFQQLIVALAYTHRVGIANRDIKVWPCG